jgi:hypothetical protein
VPQAAVVSANPEDWTPHVLDGKVESLAVAPDGLHVFAGGSFTKVDGVAQKSLVKLRLSDGARSRPSRAGPTPGSRTWPSAAAGSTSAAPSRPSTPSPAPPWPPSTRSPGALSADLNLAFTGPRTGAVNVDKFDITPTAEGSSPSATGPRWPACGATQIVVLDLAATPVAVTGWATTRYQQQCAAVFATSMRNVDVSPDGSYFVVVTTGAYRAGSLCDAAARWETAATGPSQQPTWVDDTGSDTERIGRYEHQGRIGFMPWPAASRCPPPGSAPCRATCSA